MAQAGLHIPAEPGSCVPVFRSVFADIGDEQSIASSLSTFGWHITNIASMDRDLQLPALVLLDEIGAGTDPLEGGALGVAIVDHFRRRGALVVGTTHYDALKAYAATTPGVEMAAFAFDPVSFAPTYHLLYGSPGRSLALEMAERLGLTRDDHRRGARKPGHARGGAGGSARTRGRGAARGLPRNARPSRSSATRPPRCAGACEQREAELKEREAAFRRKLTDRIDERVRAAAREIDAVVQALKRQTSALATREIGQPRLSTGDQGSLKAHARAAVEAAAARALDPEARGPEPGVRARSPRP